MTIFDNMFTLDHSITFQVPSTQEVRTKITRDQHNARASEVSLFFTGLVGGASSSARSLGYYKSNAGDIITENIIKVTVNMTTEDLEKHAESVLNFTLTKAREWGQEAITLEVDGKMHFIER